MPVETEKTTELISLALNKDHSFLLTVSPWAVGIIILLCVVFVLIKWLFGKWHGPSFEIDQAEMGLGTGKITFKPNLKDQQIAYAIWVELSTRKIGLPIDLDHDVIVEIYDSWFNFFSVTRDLIKDIPINKVKGASTQKIIKLSIGVLNDGLRPHLTSWQARFRYWYEKEIAKSGEDIDPQAIQARYSKFEELKTDLLTVNNRLIKYRDKMRELVMGQDNTKK